jgi:hypothetical protein
MDATNMGEEKASPATTMGKEKAPPATDDLEKQKLESHPLTSIPGDDEKVPVERKVPKSKAQAKREAIIGLVFIGLVVFFGLFALITWLALRPVHRPRFALNSVQIRSLAVNATGASVSADFLYNVTALNENHRMDFKYDWITIDASYRGENFGRAKVGGFMVGKASSVTTTSEMSVQHVLLSSAVATSLAAAIKNGSVPLRAYAKAKLHVKIGKYVSFPLISDLDCSLLVAPPSSSQGKVQSQACRLTRRRYKKPKAFKTYRAH